MWIKTSEQLPPKDRDFFGSNGEWMVLFTPTYPPKDDEVWYMMRESGCRSIIYERNCKEFLIYFPYWCELPDLPI